MTVVCLNKVVEGNYQLYFEWLFKRNHTENWLLIVTIKYGMSM